MQKSCSFTPRLSGAAADSWLWIRYSSFARPPAGTLTLTSPLTDLGAASLKLLLTARDGEGVTSVKPAEVTINVLRSARAPAVFHKSRYTFTVPEDAAPGTTVGTVEAMTPAGEGQSRGVCVFKAGSQKAAVMAKFNHCN